MLKLLQFIDQLPLEKPEGKLHDWVINVNLLLTNILKHNQEKTLWEWIKWKNERRNVLIFYQILSMYSLRKCMRSAWRICMWTLGLEELSLSFITTVDNTSFLVLRDIFYFVKSSGWWKVYSPCLKEWSLWAEKSLVESFSDTGFTNYAK